MLSDEVLEKVIERLVERIEKANENILKIIGRNIKEIGTLSISDVRRLGQIIKYGGDYDKIVQELSNITKINKKEIYKIFDEVAKKDYEYAKQFYDYRGKNFIPYEENIDLKRQVDAIANMTAETYENLSNTRLLGYQVVQSNGDVTFKNIKQMYSDLIDEAIISVSQGKESFNSAMYRQLKQIGSGGLRIYYPMKMDENGEIKYYSRRLDTALRMNLKDGLRELHNQTQMIFGEEFGADGVEISVHSNPAPDHAEVQGRQFTKEEFEKFQNDIDCVDIKGKVFLAEFEGHDRRSISQYNCYHYIFNIVIGVNEPLYSDKELRELNKKNDEGFDFEGKHYTMYEGTQLQRKIETEIRNMKDSQILGKESGNKELISYSQKRITQLTNKYRDLSKASGLPTKMQRMRVPRYRRIKIK